MTPDAAAAGSEEVEGAVAGGAGVNRPYLVLQDSLYGSPVQVMKVNMPSAVAEREVTLPGVRDSCICSVIACIVWRLQGVSDGCSRVRLQVLRMLVRRRMYVYPVMPSRVCAKPCARAVFSWIDQTNSEMTSILA